MPQFEIIIIAWSSDDASIIQKINKKSMQSVVGKVVAGHYIHRQMKKLRRKKSFESGGLIRKYLFLLT